eukprot:NP_508516.1 Uncharacterized protein CELE_M02F4.1 [Caenorhabditis elegans]
MENNISKFGTDLDIYLGSDGLYRIRKRVHSSMLPRESSHEPIVIHHKYALQEHLFFVSKGTFADSFFVHDGIQLFKLEDDAQFDFVSAEVQLAPSTHHIGSQVRGSSMEEVLTSDEKDLLSKAINNLPKSPKSKSDRDLERSAESGSKTRDSRLRRRHEVEDDDVVEEKKSHRRGTSKCRSQDLEYDYEDEDREEMKSRPTRRHNNNARGRSSLNHRDEDESDYENEDYEEEENKSRKANRRSRTDDDDNLDDGDNFKPRRKPLQDTQEEDNRPKREVLDLPPLTCPDCPDGIETLGSDLDFAFSTIYSWTRRACSQNEATKQTCFAFLKLLKQVGVVEVYPGIQQGSPHVLCAKNDDHCFKKIQNTILVTEAIGKIFNRENTAHSICSDVMKCEGSFV